VPSLRKIHKTGRKWGRDGEWRSKNTIAAAQREASKF